MRRVWLALVVLAGCSTRSLPEAAAPASWCRGYLIKPGEYMGSVAIRLRPDEIIVRPLIAADSVCLRTKPTPHGVTPPVDTNPHLSWENHS